MNRFTAPRSIFHRFIPFTWSTGHRSFTLFMFYHMAIHIFTPKYLQLMLCLWIFLQLHSRDLSRLKKNFKTSEFLCLPGFHLKACWLCCVCFLTFRVLYLMPVLDRETFFSILKFTVLQTILRKHFQRSLRKTFPLDLWKSYTNHSHSSVETLVPNVWNKPNTLKV